MFSSNIGSLNYHMKRRTVIAYNVRRVMIQPVIVQIALNAKYSGTVART